MADPGMPGGGGGGGGGGGPADVAGPTVVHKVKSKLGYTEMHTTAPGFNEEVRTLFHRFREMHRKVTLFKLSASNKKTVFFRTGRDSFEKKKSS